MNHELKARVISGVLMASIALLALMAGGYVFDLLVLIIAMLMIKEWNDLTATEPPSWRMAGLLYTAIPCASLIWLRGHEMMLALFPMLCVWATDTGAYFIGKKFGRHKLAPAISPGKTWEGLGGGVAAAVAIALVMHPFAGVPFSFSQSAVIAALIAVVGQAGDLFESWLKRRAGVKDSGTLIPGHGGILDRVDALVFTLPLFAIAVALAA
jgi:phosphatidate cytidylyltransferase